jgi:hypothetical protein
MARKRCREDEYASSSTDRDSIFSEVNENSTCDTDGSSVHEEDQQEDHRDLADLFADSDNTHPPEYYLQLLSSLGNHEYKGTKYANSSIALLDRVEEKWHRYVKRSRCTDYHS